jgi:alkanesulfonate monooxygenase SsuD/methylene tetrahydromethanopterin reductase-like flavin-dependent oxidoreductase (luciferase family)
MSDLYEQRLQIVEQYERAGFYAYHVAEHHSTPLGMAPSPSVFLSAVAQRTKALRFGLLVYLLPLYHPLRLAEEIAMLDHLSHGRLEVGIGRGRSPIELMLYGRDAAEAQTVFDEALAVLQLAFSEDRINFAGKHFTFQDVPVELRPLQRPHPAFWYGIGTPDSAEYYGERGFHGVTLAKPAAAFEITRRFFEASAHCGWRGRRMGICRFIVVGETDREAQDLAARAYPVWHASFIELFRRYGQKPVQIWPARFEEMAASGLAFAGSPLTLTRALSAQLQTIGSNYLVGQFVFGDMSLAESAKSVELFASRVMPALVQAHTERQAAVATG